MTARLWVHAKTVGALPAANNPPKIGVVLRAIRSLDPAGYEAAQAEARKARKSERRAALYAALCRLHGVSLGNRKPRLAKLDEATRPPRLTVDPNSDAFLESYEWRRVRMQVLKRDGAMCCCCGATRAHGVRLHVDHIKPRRTHPELALDPDNLQVLCEECNHGKGYWDATDWRDRKSDGVSRLRLVK